MGSKLTSSDKKPNFTKSCDISDQNNYGGLGLDDLNSEKSSIISKNSFDHDSDTGSFLTATGSNSDTDDSSSKPSGVIEMDL